jgi:hypothetical protein
MRTAFVEAVAAHKWIDLDLRDREVREALQKEGGKDWLLATANWVLHECVRGTSEYHGDKATTARIDSVQIRTAADAYLAAELAANIKGAKTKHYAECFMALAAALQSDKEEPLRLAAAVLGQSLCRWANNDERRVALLKGFV